MNKTCYLSSLALSFAIAMAPAKAAQLISLPSTSFHDLQQIFQLAAIPGAKPSALSPGRDTLQFINQHTDENKITHVRMQQQYAGFPVFGGYAIIHSPKPARALLNTKNDVKMNGFVFYGLMAELGQPEPSFVAHATVALQQFKAQYTNGQISDAHVEPMVYVDEKHQAFWAYKTSILLTHHDAIPERPTAIVDAKTLKPFRQWNDLKTLHTPVQGAGFGGNSHTGEYQFGKNFPLLPLSRDDATEDCFMENTAVKVVDMAHGFDRSNDPMSFHCSPSSQYSPNVYWTGYHGDGYDRENGAYSPTNDAMYAGDVIHRLYKEWYGLDVLSANGKPLQLVLRVHFGQGYENAFWDGEQMTFGDGATMLYPLVSVGIGAHEISHGFTQQNSNLYYFGQSGGMNESFSDMAAQAAEYYSVGKSSWMIGAEVLKEGSGYEALRFMNKPSRDGQSIDRADEYYDGIDVHYSSGVYNRLFYLLANKPDWNPRKAFQVMVKANQDYWTPYSTFEDGGCGIIHAAKDLNYSVADVKKVLEKVAIHAQTCEA